MRRDGIWPYNLQLLNLTIEKDDLAPANASTRNETRRLTLPNLASSDANRLETWLVFVITRALRLADQRADRYLP